MDIESGYTTNINPMIFQVKVVSLVCQELINMATNFSANGACSERASSGLLGSEISGNVLELLP